MRILTVSTEWDSEHGGVPAANQELSIGLAKAGHQVHAWVPAPVAGHDKVLVQWPTHPEVILEVHAIEQPRERNPQ